MKYILFTLTFFSYLISYSQDVDYKEETGKYYQILLDSYSKEHETMNFFSDIEGDVLILTSEMKVSTKIYQHQIDLGTLSAIKSAFYNILNYTILGTEKDREIYRRNNFETIRYISVLIDPYYNRMVLEMSIDGAYLRQFPLPEYDFIKKINTDKFFFDIN